MRVKKWVVTSTVSTWLLTLLTPLVAIGQTTSVAQQSCDGLGTPMTKADLIARAAQLGIPDDSRNMVEIAFQKFNIPSMPLLDIQGNRLVVVRVQPNTELFDSGQRRVATLDQKRKVQPDGIAPVVVAIIRGNAVTLARYDKSAFYDSKALTNGSISINYDSFQTLGFIDALTQSPAGKLYFAPPSIRPVPALIYLTTADTRIGGTTIVTANIESVALYQHVVCDRINMGGRLGTDDIEMGRGIPINPGVYTGRPTPVFPLRQGVPGTLGPLPSPPPHACGGSGC